ncbi:MAG: 4-hydroxythreonine-4-phosphate dehydrogenase PdxA, partial [Planctomycetota bacterium]
MLKATIGITIGDPDGIGPEVVVKALHAGSLRETLQPSRFLIIGDKEALAKAARSAGIDFSPVILNKPE